jgi:hypothetical protein
MRARLAGRGAGLLFSLSGLALTGCGGSDLPPPSPPTPSPSTTAVPSPTARPRPQTVARADLHLAPQFARPPFIVPRPQSLDFSLLLFEDRTGVLGVIGLPARAGIASLSAITWSRVGDADYAIDPGQVAALGNGALSRSQLSLTLADDDGDGVREAGGGAIAGEWTAIQGDVVDQSSFEGAVAASADLEDPEAALVSASDLPPGTVLVTDAVRVLFSEPIDWAAARERVRVLVDGVALSADPQPERSTRGLVTGVRFDAPSYYPFGARLTLDLGGLADSSGNASQWDGGALTTAADPGDLRANGGFEDGLARWTVVGPAQSVGRFEGVDPAAGSSQALLLSGAYLLGYFDVPADAIAMHLKVAVLSEIGEFEPGRTVISMHSGAGTTVLFDAADHQQDSTPCDCSAPSDFGELIPWRPLRADLTGSRGKRIFLRATTHGIHFIGLNFYGLLIDDVRIQ